MPDGQESNDEAYRIHNPYRAALQPREGVVEPHHPRAPGLDGQALDQLMMARFTEGVEVGREEAERRFAEVFDQGTRAGLHTGESAGLHAMAHSLLPALEEMFETLMVVAKRTGSPSLRVSVHDVLSDNAEAIERCRSFAERRRDR